MLRILFFLLFLSPPLFSDGIGSLHEALPRYAEKLTHSSAPFHITNSMIMIWLSLFILILLARSGTKKISIIPGFAQNLVEWVVESLFLLMESILGLALAKRTFWFFGSVFLFILMGNWLGLLPGIGTIGWELSGSGIDPHDRFRPFFRGGNADLNTTAALGLTFAILWFVWAIQANGLKGFLAHLFAPKGKFKGIFMIVSMSFVFFFVGVLELISILLRPVALSFRLYGNSFAGENILEAMGALLADYQWLSWLPPIPFYFLELLVGFVQALVFTLLTAVFLKLICEHETC